MNLLLTVLVAAALQAPPTAWTWTLYDGEGPLVLANETPDTPDLRATLQCERGADAVTVSVYGQDARPGFARISAGDASTASETRRGRGDQLSFVVRADHPVFAAFAATGVMTVAAGQDQSRVIVQPQHLSKLRRFTDLCAG